MITCFFRFVDKQEDTSIVPTGFVGIAVARDLHELFWEIDEHGDPFSVQVCPVDRGTVCFLMGPRGRTSSIQPTDAFPDPYQLDPLQLVWKTPEWPSLESLYGRDK